MKTQKKRFLLAALTAFLGVAFGTLASEFAIRWIAPQSISGSWLYVNSSGLVMNKSEGRAMHTVGDRVVYYTFEYPGIRKTSSLDTEHKVLVLGDSFTFGWGLNDEETFVQLLENRAHNGGYRRLRFVNAATGGWGLDSYLRYIEEYGDVVRPCLTLLFLNTDDVGRAWKNRLYVYNEYSGLKRAKKTFWVKQLLQGLPFYGYVVENSHAMQLLRQTYLLLVSGSRSQSAGSAAVIEGPSSPEVGDIHGAVTLGFALVEEIAKTVEQIGSDLIILTTGWHRPPYDDREVTRAFMLQAPSVLSEKKIKFTDLSPAVQPRLDAIGNRARIPFDQHPSAEAAAIIAEVAWHELAIGLAESRCRVAD